jgi:hypothetical protein
VSAFGGLGAMREKLAQALADRTGLGVYPYPPDKPAAPCGFIDWALQTLTLTDGLGAGCFDLSEVSLRVRWLTPKAQQDGPARLDALIDQTLDVAGALDGVHGPYDWAPPRPVTFGDVTHLVADLTLRVDL